MQFRGELIKQTNSKQTLKANMSFSGLHAKMTEAQFGELMMRANAQAMQIVSLRQQVEMFQSGISVQFPMIFRRNLDDPGRHGAGAMEDAFGDVDPDERVVIYCGVWHDGTLDDEDEQIVLPDGARAEIRQLREPLLQYVKDDEETVGLAENFHGGQAIVTTSRTLQAFLSSENIWHYLPLTRSIRSSQITVFFSQGREPYINHQPAPPYYMHGFN